MAKIIDIDDHGQPLEDIKFKLKINTDQAEEIVSYNQLMDYIQKGTDAEEDPDSLFKFRDIVAHQGPLESTDPNHKGSKYNVMVEWESGEVTYEPLALISKDDSITCAVYASSCTFQSKEQHTMVTPADLRERWYIGRGQATETLKFTTQ